MPNASKIVAVTSDAGTWYLVPKDPFAKTRYGADPTWATADGQPLGQKRDSRTYNWSWRPSPTPPQTLIATRRGEQTRTGWRLKDPDAVSAKYPLEVTNEEWVERGFHDEGDSPAGTLYRAVYDQASDETFTVEVAAMVVVPDAVPPPEDDGLTWVVNIHDEMKRHPELLHLFPGHLPGFREAVVEALQTIPEVHRESFVYGASVDRDRRNVVNVSVGVPYEPYHTTFVPDIGPRRRGKNVPDTMRLSMSLTVSDLVEGPTRAEAKAKWLAEIERIVAQVRAALEPRPCWHCKGTGVVSARQASDAAA